MRRLGELPAGLGAVHLPSVGRAAPARRVGFMPDHVGPVDFDAAICAAIVAAKGWGAQPAWCPPPVVRGMGLTPVDQAVEGIGPDGKPRGDCLSASVATILDLPTSAVSLFTGSSWPAQVAQLNEWLAPRGLVASVSSTPPAGPSVAKGPSPRFTSVDHCVVAVDGRIVHDPHSSRAGLRGPATAYLSIVPVGAARGMGGTPGALDWTPPTVSIPGIPNPISGPAPDPSTMMVKKIPIATGPEGTLQTLQVAGNMAIQAASDPFFADEARSVVRPCAGRDYSCYARAVFDYMLGRDEAAGGVPRLVYREQPIAADADGNMMFNMLQSPGQIMFVTGGGLCLDIGTAICAYDLASGMGCAMKAVFLDASKSEASHVFPVAITRDGNFAQDVVPVPAVFNTEPPTSLYTRDPIFYVVARP